MSAFAIDPTTGLGVADESLKVKVFRPFFIQLSLPYSIIRGESVALRALVFNYQKTPVRAEVSMDNVKGQFDFAGEAVGAKKSTRQVTIPAFDAVAVNFVITPKQLGNIDIVVKATTDHAGDAIDRKLLVKPEGQPQYFNKAMFVRMDEGAAKMQKTFTVDVPANFVPGSLLAKVSGIADILGPSMNHIDDLLHMPYGCGEQNMM